MIDTIFQYGSHGYIADHRDLPTARVMVEQEIGDPVWSLVVCEQVIEKFLKHAIWLSDESASALSNHTHSISQLAGITGYIVGKEERKLFETLDWLEHDLYPLPAGYFMRPTITWEDAKAALRLAEKVRQWVVDVSFRHGAEGPDLRVVRL